MPNNSPFCESCEMRTDDFRHLKNCVEPKNWPTGPYPSSDGRLKRLRGLPEGAESLSVVEVEQSSTLPENAPEIALQSVPSWHLTHTCECGYIVPDENKNPAGTLRLHRINAKAHKEWVKNNTLVTN